MLIFVSSSFPAAVQICGKDFFRSGTDKTIFELDMKEIFCKSETECERVNALLILTPVSSGAQPLCAELLFSCSGIELALTGECPGIRVIDWSIETNDGTEFERIYELIPECQRRGHSLESKQLDRLEFERDGGERTEVVLYRDCGLRLSIIENGVERGLILGSGEDGELRLIDAGFARLIIVHLKGCPNCISAFESEDDNERLMLFNERFELSGEIHGDRLFIEDGYLIAVNELGTVLAHQQRLKYEISADGLRICSGFVLQEDAVDAAIGEIGFFTHPKRENMTDEETALALMECTLLGREDETMSLLSPTLADGLDFAALTAFMGDFDEARKAPFSKRNSAPIIGAVKEGRAKAYAFEVENGLINDISELEPHDLRHSKEFRRE